MSITRRRFCGSLAAGAGLAMATRSGNLFGEGVPGDDPSGGLATPTPQQLAWQDLELGLFIHFDMVTYTGQTKPRSPADVNTYNPTKLDTDQWLETAKSMGAKYAVFVAKHCTGFLSWQSNAYPYGVKQTSWRDGKGDVVRDFIASCKKYDIRPGLYASVSSTAWWGVDNPGVIKWGDKKQADYIAACELMMTELWSNYGPLTEIWFDGGVLPPENGGPDLVPILEKHQPHAVVFQGPSPGGIRWIGNERGVAGYPCWSTVKKLNDKGAGNPDGKIWNPGECDVPLPGHRWFWRGEAKPGKPSDQQQEKVLASLIDMYYRSVGRNCNLLLNATPDTTGLIPEVILPHYANFGKEIRRRFATPVAETKGEGETVELVLRKPAKIDHVIVMEDIKHGERVRAYEIEGLVPGNKWQKLCDGISIGHKRIQRFDPQEVSKLRFRATKSADTPQIRRLAVFSVE
jgi:alpha-L-fucosidase